MLAPKDYSAEWLARVAAERRSDPEWMPMVYTDPRLPNDLALADFSFKTLQVLEEGRALIVFDGEILLLNFGPDHMVDGRFYSLKGLIKPAGRHQYVNTLNSLRTVQAITYCGSAPDLPPVERIIVADKTPSRPAQPPPVNPPVTQPPAHDKKTTEEPAAKPAATSVKAVEKPIAEPLRKVTIDPIRPRIAHIATSKYALANAMKEPSTEANWIKRGDLRRITTATEVEVVSREKDYSKIKLDGKEWYIDSYWIPVGSK